MVAKAILAILKNSGKAGERVKKFLNKSQDEIEDFVVNTLKDKRSIKEIIKEDGKAGVNKLDDAISSRLNEKKKIGAGRAKEIKELVAHTDNPNRKPWPAEKAKGGMAKKKRSVKKAKGGMVTKWESKWG